MNYAFKMMAVVLAFGVLILQGCVVSVEDPTINVKKKSFDY